ncbi:hypothetical protein R3P38DRAFT_2604316, partial [Favolaschia claudopus]
MSLSSPLNLQELLDRCIGHINRPTDLIFCSLVARSWVDPSQRALFRAPHRTKPIIEWSDKLLLATLNASPRLIRLVREIKAAHVLSRLTHKTLMDICNFPFTHLQKVYIDWEKGFVPNPLHQILSIPTVTHIKLHVSVESIWNFMHIWEHVSPALRHLDVQFSGCRRSSLPSVPPDLVLIPLHTLRLKFVRNQHDVFPWILYPFALENLTAVSIDNEMGVDWNVFAKQSITVLDIVFTDAVPIIDLTAFPNLSWLCVRPTNKSSG